MAVRIKPLGPNEYTAVLAVDPADVEELFRIDMCGYAIGPDRKPCMRPVGHEGTEHFRFVVALAIVAAETEPSPEPVPVEVRPAAALEAEYARAATEGGDL
jgi:hypothetical protein